MGKNWAVAIGINQYKYGYLRSLSYAKQDALSIHAFLKNEASFDEVLLFTDDSPPFQAELTIPERVPLLRFFEKEFAQPFLLKDDSLWLFFSGHGIRTNGKDYLLPADADPELAEQTGISIDYIVQRLTCSGAGYKFLILDACRIDGSKGANFDSLNHEDITVIFSCQPNETSWEIGDPIHHGIFTYALLAAFRKQLNVYSLTASQLEIELQKSTKDICWQYGKPIQSPHIRCESANRSNLTFFPPSFQDRRLQKRRLSKSKKSKISKLLLLKKAALDAEESKQFEFAEDLWNQIRDQYPSELMRYESAIKRIEAQKDILKTKSMLSTASTETNEQKSNYDFDTTSIYQTLRELEKEYDSLSLPKSYLSDSKFEYSKTDKGYIKSYEGIGRYFSELIEDTEIQMILVPGGSFTMGSDNGKSHPNEIPLHTVTVKPFFIGKFPISKRQWRKIAQLPKVEIDLLLRPCLKGGKDHPAVEVSWYEAREFCNRLSQRIDRQYRLPTEAEWEYACRAGTTTPFHSGNSINRQIAACNVDHTCPVNDFRFANAFGLYGMHGNIWEWCEDCWHKDYEGAPSDGSAWLQADMLDNRVLRGGSWKGDASLCRSASRTFDSAYSRSNNVGFRVVCSAFK